MLWGEESWLFLFDIGWYDFVLFPSEVQETTVTVALVLFSQSYFSSRAQWKGHKCLNLIPLTHLPVDLEWCLYVQWGWGLSVSNSSVNTSEEKNAKKQCNLLNAVCLCLVLKYLFQEFWTKHLISWIVQVSQVFETPHSNNTTSFACFCIHTCLWNTAKVLEPIVCSKGLQHRSELCVVCEREKHL